VRTILDELFIRRDRLEAVKSRLRPPIIVMLSWVSWCCIGGGILPWCPKWVQAVVVAPIMAGGGWFVWWGFAYQSAVTRYYDMLRKETESIPPQFMLTALQLYGDDDWQLAAVECWKGHVGGDCPLCGAE
jgi:hypothetical protein